MVFGAVLRGFGLLFDILLGSRCGCFCKLGILGGRPYKESPSVFGLVVLHVFLEALMSGTSRVAKSGANDSWV